MRPLALPAGLSLAEIVAVAVPDPTWHDHAVVLIGDERIDRAAWTGYRLPPGTALAVHIVPRGQSGWRIAGMIALAVLAITVSAVTYGQLAPIVGPMWAGATISIGGTFALNALVPPPVPEISRDAGKDKPSWVITGARNRADSWGKVPFLLGRFRLTPPYAAIPYREIVGGDIYWRAIFALSHGPVAIEELRIGGTLLGNFSGVETESCAAATGRCRTGAPGTRRRDLPRRGRPSATPGRRSPPARSPTTASIRRPIRAAGTATRASRSACTRRTSTRI